MRPWEPVRRPAVPAKHGVKPGGRQPMNRRRLTVVLGAVGLATAATIALVLVFALGGSAQERFSKFASDPDAAARGNSVDTPDLGPISYDAYLSAERTYPANVIPPAV